MATRHFIVLEKDDDLRELYQRKLHRKFKGCVVVEAASCAAAVEGLRQGPIDAIVVNQAAVDARGVEMIEIIRHTDTVVPLVSIGDPQLEKDSLRHGANIFVRADQWESLGEAVEWALDHRGQAAAS